MLNPYRRHLDTCSHKPKGAAYYRCECPIWVYGELPNGQPVRKSLKTNDWQAALMEIDRMARGEITVQPPKSQAGVSIHAAIEALLADCERRQLRPATLTSYRKSFSHLDAAFGERIISTLTIDDLAQWSQSRRGKKGKPLTPRTATKEIEHVRALYRFAMDREWATKNPGARLKPPKVPKKPATMPFSPAEVGRLLAAVESFGPPHQREALVPRIRALVLVLLYTGLRISDLVRLTRDRIEWKAGYLALRQEKTGEPVRIKLPPDVVNALDALPHNLFRSEVGCYATTERTLRRALYRLGSKAGVRIHPHRFRDTFAVNLLTNGADIYSVQRLLGHESVKVTEKHYAHFVKEHQARLDAAVSKLNYKSAEEPVSIARAG